MVESSPPPTKNDAEQRRRAVEVGTQIKKLLDARRMFEPGHESLETLQDHVWGKIKDYLDNFGDLAMELSATTVTIEEKDVITASREEDSISYPLFAGGVHEILIAPSLARDEFFKFFEIWSSATLRQRESGEHQESLMTQFWEADFQAIELVAISTTSEGGIDEEEFQRQRELRKVMRSVTGGLTEFGDDGQVKQSAEGFWQMREDDPAKLVEGRRLDVDNPIAVQLLAAELNMTLTPDDVVAPSAPHVPPPSAEAIEQMKLAVEEEWMEGTARRFLLAMCTVASEAGDAELESMTTSVARVLEAMVSQRRFGEMAQTLEDAKMTVARSGDANRGFVVFQALLDVLANPNIIDPTIDALDNSEALDGASRLLRLLNQESVDTLLNGLGRLGTGPAVEQLLIIIGEKHPPPNSLARIARDSSPMVAQAILQFTANTDEAEEVRKCVLNHPDRRIRRRMIETLTPADVPQVARQLHPLFTDQDRMVRERALLLCLQAADQTAVPPLGNVLEDKKLQTPDRIKIATALGKLGGVEAGIVLRRVFMSARDTDLRVAAALALAEMGDRAARPMLEKEASRFLNRGGLKAACLEALRRLDARTSYGPSTKGP